MFRNECDRSYSPTFRHICCMDGLRKRSTCFFALLLLCPCLILLTNCATMTENQTANLVLDREEIGRGSRPLSIERSSISQGTETIVLEPEGLNARNEGGQILRSVSVWSPEIHEIVRKDGPPDAIEVHSGNEVLPPLFISLFYKSPPRTLIYRSLPFISFEEVADIPAVPRSTERQVFSRGPIEPPWPITVPSNDAGAFGTPDQPGAPGPLNPTEFSSSYASTSKDIRAGISELKEGTTFDRAAGAFSRLNPSTLVPGFAWGLVIFRSPENLAFSVPDGTIFLSNHMIDRLNDDEIAAITAHLVAHQAYGHDRTFWAPRLIWWRRLAP